MSGDEKEFVKLVFEIKKKRAKAKREKLWKEMGKNFKYPSSITIKLTKKNPQ